MDNEIINRELIKEQLEECVRRSNIVALKWKTRIKFGTVQYFPEDNFRSVFLRNLKELVFTNKSRDFKPFRKYVRVSDNYSYIQKVEVNFDFDTTYYSNKFKIITIIDLLKTLDYETLKNVKSEKVEEINRNCARSQVAQISFSELANMKY